VLLLLRCEASARHPTIENDARFAAVSAQKALMRPNGRIERLEFLNNRSGISTISSLCHLYLLNLIVSTHFIVYFSALGSERGREKARKQQLKTRQAGARSGYRMVIFMPVV
jgi:hypothetical protein